MKRVSIRALIAADLRPLLPPKWKVMDYTDEMNHPLHPVVQLQQQTVAKTPSAPLGLRDLGILFHLLVPETNPATADDALEEALDILLDSIEQLSSKHHIKWDGADRDAHSNLPAYDISTTVTIQHRYAEKD